MFNIVTIAREYGSGGADIGRKVSELLGWECVDKQIIERVTTMGKLDLTWVTEADERSRAWWERVLAGFRPGGLDLYSGGIADTGVDHDKLQQFTARVIGEVGKAGNCVIIGRSAQCVLRDEPRAFHVLVYAPIAEKVERMKHRHPHEHNLQTLLHRIDSERTRYTRDYYGCDWSDRGLYQLCLNSAIGLDACAELIVNAIRSSESEPAPKK